MRILIAEDETIIRLDLKQLLERAGYDVVAEAKDGEEAVALARAEEPELAILDVKMPKLDGIEAARRILEERPVPIVMLTAYGQQELVARAVEAGGTYRSALHTVFADDEWAVAIYRAMGTRNGIELDVEQALVIRLRDGMWADVTAVPLDPSFARFWA